MPAVVHVAVHPSLFPENVQRGLLESLRSRCIDPKFHYTSYKQSQKWLALHEAYAPSRRDADCDAIYELSFKRAANTLPATPVHLIGLGCGGGQKDARLLSVLAGRGRKPIYTPCDISLSLVLTASAAAQKSEPAILRHPLLCDLGAAPDLHQVFEMQGAAQTRLLTFFGMIPNFEPATILPRLAALVRPGDLLLFSANLAPGPDYAAGVEQILPGYDNPETRDWLLTFLYDLGVEPGEGAIHFSIEESAAAFKRIVADYCFVKPRSLAVYGERFEFQAGEKLRLFFSYRYTPDRVVPLLLQYNLSMTDQWIAQSGEEGVFLCRRAGG